MDTKQRQQQKEQQRQQDHKMAQGNDIVGITSRNRGFIIGKGNTTTGVLQNFEAKNMKVKSSKTSAHDTSEDDCQCTPRFTGASKPKDQDQENDTQTSESDTELENNRLKKLIEEYKERERSLEEHVKTLENDLEYLGQECQGLVTERDGLILQCNQLIRQKGRRRGDFFTEIDDKAMKEAFDSLAYEVRSWCVELWDQRHTDARLRFSAYPLAERERLPPVFPQDHRLLVASLWEWLLKMVFGVAQRYDPRMFDLWNDREVAQSVKKLDKQVGRLHTDKPDIQREWRSFTAQCLGGPHVKSFVSARRYDELATKIMNSFVGPLGISDPRVTRSLKQSLGKNVIQEVALYTQMIACRAQPTTMSLPWDIASALAGAQDGLISVHVKPRLSVQDTVLVEEETVIIRIGR